MRKDERMLGKVVRLCKRLHSLVRYSWRFHSWGWKSTISRPDLLFNPGQISIGDNVEIRKGSRLETFNPENKKKPKIEIGAGTSIHFYFPLWSI